MSRYFTGTDLGYLINMPQPATISISAFVRLSSFENAYPRIAMWSSTNGANAVLEQTGPRMRFERGGSFSNSPILTVADGNWHHVVFTHTGTVTTMYLDGVLQTPLNQDSATSATGTGTFIIGNRTAQDRVLGGDMAYLSVYGRVLTQSEVDEIGENGWLDGDPDLMVRTGPDMEYDYVTATNVTYQGTTLKTGDDPVFGGGAPGNQTLTVSTIATGESFGAVSVSQEGIDFVSPSSISSAQTVANPVVAVIAIPPPTSLDATAVSPTEVYLTWVDNASNETYYVIERSTDSEGIWAILNEELPAGTEEYSDTTVAASTTYHYRVKARRIG